MSLDAFGNYVPGQFFNFTQLPGDSANFGVNIQTTLIGWAKTEAYTFSATPTLDSDNLVTSGNVLWPDGTAGVYTMLVKDTQQPKPNSWTITYAGTVTYTVTQPTITRDANGIETATPLMIVT